MGRDFPPVQTGPGAHPASCTMGTGSFPGIKDGRGVLLTTHPLLVPRSWNSRAIPLPNLWATTGPIRGTLYFFFYLSYITIHSGPEQLGPYTNSLRAALSGDRIPVRGGIFRNRPCCPWGPAILLYNGHRLISGDKTTGAWR